MLGKKTRRPSVMRNMPIMEDESKGTSNMTEIFKTFRMLFSEDKTRKAKDLYTTPTDDEI